MKNTETIIFTSLFLFGLVITASSTPSSFVNIRSDNRAVNIIKSNDNNRVRFSPYNVAISSDNVEQSKSKYIQFGPYCELRPDF